MMRAASLRHRGQPAFLSLDAWQARRGGVPEDRGRGDPIYPCFCIPSACGGTLPQATTSHDKQQREVAWDPGAPKHQHHQRQLFHTLATRLLQTLLRDLGNGPRLRSLAPGISFEPWSSHGPLYVHSPNPPPRAQGQQVEALGRF